MALAIACEPPNAVGLVAGTPPIGGRGPSSQTAGLPSPSGRDTSTCRSGRTFGSLGDDSKVTEATGKPLMPGRASM